MTRHRNLTPFQQALLDSVLNEDKDALEEKEPVAFSEDFMRRMNKLVKQTQGALSFKTKRVLRNILIAAIIVSLLVGTVMAIPVIREAIIDFFLIVLVLHSTLKKPQPHPTKLKRHIQSQTYQKDMKKLFMMYFQTKLVFGGLTQMING